MKKSNIIFIIWLVVLYFTPLIVWATYSLKGDDGASMGTNFKIIYIENPQLKTSDVIISTDTDLIGGTGTKAIGKNYIYYQGTKKYLPSFGMRNGTFYIEEAKQAPEGEKLQLHIQIKGAEQIILNGETIWHRP